MTDLSDIEWINPDVLPDWSDIHDNVLSEARRTAATVYQAGARRSDLISADADTGLRIGGEHIGPADFMRRVGFDPRFIIMTTSWVEEFRSTIEKLVHIYIAEIMSSLDALNSADSEEVTFDG